MHVKRMLNERYGFIDYQTMFWALDHSDEPREGMRAFIEALRAHHVTEEDYRAFEKPVYFTWGSLTHERWTSMERRLSKLFPNFSSEMFEGLHHLNTSHTAEPQRVAARLATLWQRAG